MCGLVGFASTITPALDTLINLFQEVQIRGLHAFGIVYCDTHEAIHAKKFSTMNALTTHTQDVRMFDAIVHTRYSTSGDWKTEANNQPITIGDWHLVFNGVISMKTKSEMEAEWDITMQSDNDGEIFLQYVMAGHDPSQFVFDMEGSFAGLWYDDAGNLFALRNERRPLWYFHTDHCVYFASTLDVIRRACGDEVATTARECVPGVVYDVRDMLLCETCYD